MDQITEYGLECVPEMIRVIVNTAMKNEREEYLGAKEYERSQKRRDQANGFKKKTVRTRNGDITFAIPQVRESGFYPHALQKGMWSERALTLTMAEMYVQEVSVFVNLKRTALVGCVKMISH